MSISHFFLTDVCLCVMIPIHYCQSNPCLEAVPCHTSCTGSSSLGLLVLQCTCGVRPREQSQAQHRPAGRGRTGTGTEMEYSATFLGLCLGTRNYPPLPSPRVGPRMQAIANCHAPTTFHIRQGQGLILAPVKRSPRLAEKRYPLRVGGLAGCDKYFCADFFTNRFLVPRFWPRVKPRASVLLAEVMAPVPNGQESRALCHQLLIQSPILSLRPLLA
jgi:hypothetical protein